MGWSPGQDVVWLPQIGEADTDSAVGHFDGDVIHGILLLRIIFAGGEKYDINAFMGPDAGDGVPICPPVDEKIGVVREIQSSAKGIRHPLALRFLKKFAFGKPGRGHILGVE